MDIEVFYKVPSGELLLFLDCNYSQQEKGESIKKKDWKVHSGYKAEILISQFCKDWYRKQSIINIKHK